MATTRTYAPETMPRYGAGYGTQSGRISTSYAPSRPAERVTMGYGTPSRSYATGRTTAYTSTASRPVAGPTVRMDNPYRGSGTSSRPAGGYTRATADYAAPSYWNGSTAPDYTYWDELSSSVYAWEDAEFAPAPAPAPATRTRSSQAAPARKAAPAGRPARKPAPAPQKTMIETAWETRDEAVTAFNALPSHVVLAIVTAIFIVALAVVSFVRIGWNSDTVLVQMKSEELSQTITSTRLAGRLLEVQRGSMVTASRIRVEALYRGMMEPDSTESLVLKPDTIVVDEEGHLSLAGSIMRVAEASADS